MLSTIPLKKKFKTLLKDVEHRLHESVIGNKSFIYAYICWAI